MTGTVNRKVIAAAIFDPGATEGLKGERTLTEWQTDAVMRALTASASEPVAWLGEGRGGFRSFTREVSVADRWQKTMTVTPVYGPYDASPVPASEPEPVAWRYRLKGLKAWNYYEGPIFDLPKPEDFEREPVYAKPVPTPDGAVTDAMVEAAQSAWQRAIIGAPVSEPVDDRRRRCIRAALSAALSHPADGWRERIEDYYARQIDWSRNTFGPGARSKGVVEHIRKELKEIEAAPHDLSEWVDVIILAMDGFWRHGGEVSDLMPRLLAKQQKNMARRWPDWRTMSEDNAIEHDRSGEPAAPLDAKAERE